MTADDHRWSSFGHDVEASCGPRPVSPQTSLRVPWADASASAPYGSPLASPGSERRSQSIAHTPTLLAVHRARANSLARSDRSAAARSGRSAMSERSVARAEDSEDSMSPKSVWKEKSRKSAVMARSATMLSESNKSQRGALASQSHARRRLSSSRDSESFAYNPDWKSSCKPDTSQKRYCPPRLWVTLVMIFMLLIADLTVVTAIWVFTSRGAVKEMQIIINEGVENLHRDFSDISQGLIRQIHKKSSRVQESVIQQILKQTTTVVDLNRLMVKTQGVTADTIDLDVILHWMWLQLGQEFLQVEGISLVLPNGLYVEYERDSQRAGHLGQNEETFTLEFAPPAKSPSSSHCSGGFFCPPCQNLTSGHIYHFSVDPTDGKWEHMLASYTFRATSEPWYKEAVQADGNLVWYGPYVPRPAIKSLAQNEQRQRHNSVALRAGRAYSRNGSVAAVLFSDITLDYLSHMLKNLTSGDGAIIFIMDFQGRLLSHSRGMGFVASWGENGSFESLILAKDSECDLTRRVAREIFRDENLESWADSRPKGTFATVIQDGDGDPANDIIYTDTIYQSGSGNSAIEWIIVDAQLMSTYRNPIEKAIDATQVEIELHAEKMMTRETDDVLIVSASLWGVSVAISVAVLTCVSQQITRPLRQLHKDMCAFARFDVDVIDKMATTKAKPTETCGLVRSDTGSTVMIREIAEICESFSYMATGLQSFARYMDTHLVQVLVRSRRQAQLGMAPADVTIFFSDLVGFTAMAERLDTTLVMDVLGTYLEEMSSIVMSYGGVVGEFIGDAIMAWWNAPPLEYGEGHSEVAVAAALSQQDKLAKLNVIWQSRGLPHLSMRVGLARGTVLSGNLGSHRRMKYGLVGDSVNLASRLEGLCKRYGVGSLVDDNVHQAPGVKECFHLRPVDLVRVKGRTQPTELFELVGRRPPRGLEARGQAREALAFCEEFASAHALFRKSDFQSALAVLDSYQRRWPDDQPAQMLRERCEELSASPPGPDWSPVTALTEK